MRILWVLGAAPPFSKSSLEAIFVVVDDKDVEGRRGDLAPRISSIRGAGKVTKP